MYINIEQGKYKMKKLLYLCWGNIHDDGKSNCALRGVNKKINYHLIQFRKNGYKVQLKYVESKGNSWANLLGVFSSYMSWDAVYSVPIYDVVYIRFAHIDYGFIRLMMKFKKRNPKVKILLEIPTYPYKGEMIGLKSRVLYMKDRLYSSFLRFCIDRIVLSTPDFKKLFGVRTLYVPNGVDYNSVGETNYTQTNVNEIHLIAVSTMQFWHGYDRLIRGMADFYKMESEYQVILHLVGNGDAFKDYKKLVQENRLEKYVIFEGPQEGRALDIIYEKSFIGVASLGIHRIDPSLKVSTLKIKEYVSRGLPVITAGYTDMYNNKTKRYILKLQSDDSNIDIDKIVQFYLSLFPQSKCIRNTVRETFRPYCDMEKLFKPIMDYLN